MNSRLFNRSNCIGFPLAEGGSQVIELVVVNQRVCEGLATGPSGRQRQAHVRFGSCVTSIAGPNGYAQQTQGVNASTSPAAFLPRCQTA